MYKLGFIGVGNMGGAILDACAERVDGRDIIIADFSRERLEHFTEKYGCACGTSYEVAESAQFVFIGVKPQAAREALAEISPAIAAREVKPVVVSMMAGVTMQSVREMCGCDAPVIRIMPNVCASVGEGMILVSSLEVSDDVLGEFLGIMSAAGSLDKVPEGMIDAGTAVQGCGPAYVCMFIEALADGAVKCGIPRKKAYEYAIKTVRGTAVLLEETGKHPAVVKDEVTSPAGSTIEGIDALEAHGFRGAVIDAVVSAFEKNKKLK